MIKLFTHTDLDGIGCAILAYLAFGRDNVDVEFCNYDDVDEKVEKFIEDEEMFRFYDMVFITDISVSEGTALLVGLRDVPHRKVRLFDHHATTLWLNEYEWCTVMVEHHYSGIKTSGTELFSMHLFENEHFNYYDAHTIENIYRFVDIVRDYDTWRWKELGNDGIVCKQVNDLFHILGRDEFIKWAINQINGLNYVTPLQKFPYFGEKELTLLEQKQREIDSYVEEKNEQLFISPMCGKVCGFLFAERFISELGNRLCEIHPEIDFVAIINMSSKTVSYRTVKDNIDLGRDVASLFGGGGHPKAAGSTFDNSILMKTIQNIFQ